MNSRDQNYRSSPIAWVVVAIVIIGGIAAIFYSSDNHTTALKPDQRADNEEQLDEPGHIHRLEHRFSGNCAIRRACTRGSRVEVATPRSRSPASLRVGHRRPLWSATRSGPAASRVITCDCNQLSGISLIGAT